MAELGQNFFYVNLLHVTYNIIVFMDLTLRYLKNATFQTIIAYHIGVARKARTQFICKTLRFGTT